MTNSPESRRQPDTDAVQRDSEILPLSEERYRLLVESLPHLVWMANRDGLTDYMNQRGAAHFGLPAEAVYGWGWLAILHPDDQERSRTSWEQAVRLGTHYRNEYRVRGADGTYRWYLTQGVPLKGRDGTVERWVGTWTDIDDLRRAKESLSRDALLLAQVRDAVIVTDLSGVVTHWNEGATRIFGWTADEMIGRPQMDRLPEHARARTKEIFQGILEGSDWSGEWEDYRKDGSRVWIDARVSLITDSAGAPLAVMGVSHDISDRKRAERELRMRDRAIHAVTQGILITDPSLPDNPIIFASPGFERLTGYLASEVLGHNCRFLQGKDTDAAPLDELRQAIREGRPCTVSLINYRKDGTPFWNELSIAPVRDRTGKLTQYVGVQTDITQRRLLEEQYRQSQKMEAIGLLAGGVAHDFNNLLTTILGYSELLLHSIGPEDPSRELLLEIKTAGERSAALTQQLLAFGRKQVLTLQVIDLNDIVRHTEKMLRRVIGEDVHLETALELELASVKADPGQMEQVLLNLAVNARDAMPEGGKLNIVTANLTFDDVQAASHAGMRPGSYVRLTVSDSGVGMTEEVQRHMFEPFFTTKARGKGTGLGLAVVHGIVRQSEGVIEVETAPGKGTTVRVYLPRVDQAPRRQRPVPGPVAAPTGTETILFVEDEGAVRELGRHVLQEYGYTVLDASGGAEALAVVEQYQGKIHLLVTDVVMPGMGGRQLAERLQSQFADLKVLYVSGYTDDSVMRHGIMQDKVNFLQKPFSPLGLAQKVREVLTE